MSFLLHQARFYKTVGHLFNFPKSSKPEIAFTGRSNSGKSTAINVLCNQKRLAFVSKKPGRTKNINYFLVGPETNPIANMVDLPGYGYAGVSTIVKAQWEILLSTYIAKRSQLCGLILMMDSRRPLTSLDRLMMEWLMKNGKRIHILLAKCDKLTRQECKATLCNIENELDIYHRNDLFKCIVTAQLFSAQRRIGLDRAHSLIEGWIS
ncbi:MAG: ribosome biogenesis GTP-binding protein YihA/YsxC [Burkholderia sp.]|nr:ribosome biogenesis GTP-binding protein YihA/YsxC [Burkholderia sp.]